MNATCPKPGEIVKLLEAKAELARNAYVYDAETRSWRLRRDVLSVVAAKMFGRLQRLDYSVEPDEAAVMSYRRTVPALIACLHKHFYARGELRNIVMTLYGHGGVGKSTVAFYVVDTAGGIIITPEDDYASILANLFESRMWVPAIVFDDVAAMISKYWLWSSKEERIKAIRLFRVLEYVRDITGLLLLTARNFEGVAKRLRELQSLYGYMREVVLGDHLVTIIEWYDASGLQKRPKYLDIVYPGVRIPSDVFNEMLEKRRRKALELLRGSNAEEAADEDTVNGGEGEAV